MNLERWLRVHQVFTEAEQLPLSERDRYLDKACAGDVDLRAEVVELLEHLEQASAQGFLNCDRLDGNADPFTGPHTPATAATTSDPVESAVRYQPLRFHKAGGLGEVHLARDERLQREVALKRIRADRADDPEYRRRFLREAEITSRLAHPGIVPVFGLAESADGRPGYAMRFIEGETLQNAIRRFHEADQQGRDPGERSVALRQLLTRFVSVCNTMAYAHSRGVIHRDLKPANIMLGEYGETLVVDWGLAKQLPADRDEATPTTPTVLVHTDQTPEDTVTGRPLGTVAYMSPEQEAGRWNEVGPASDIFSLGATLYAVLTGAAPAPVVRQGRFELLAANRRRTPGALAAICAKAMAPKSADRYAAATDLAADLECWLADERVSAYRESWRERAARWVRRHRLSATAGVVVLAAMVVVALVVAVLSEQGRRAVAAERDRATVARDDARDVVEVMSSQGQLEVLEKQEKLTAEQEKLIRALLGYYQRYVQEDAKEEREKARQVQGYFRIGMMQNRLGYKEEAVKTYYRTLHLCTKLVDEFPAAPHYCQELAASHHNLGSLLAEIGKEAEVERQHRYAIALQVKLAADFPTVPQYKENLARSHNSLGNSLTKLGKHEKGEEEYRCALGLLTQLVTDFPTIPKYRYTLAAGHSNLGSLLSRVGKRVEAENEYRCALELLANQETDISTPRGHRETLAASRHNLGNLLRELGKHAEAEKEYRYAIDLHGKLAAEYPTVPEYRQELAKCHDNLGILLHQIGKRSEAEEVRHRAAKLYQKLADDYSTLSSYRRQLAVSHHNRGVRLSELGKLSDAEREYRRALGLFASLVTEFSIIPQHHLELATCHQNLGNLLRDLGKYLDAEREYRRGMNLFAKLTTEFHSLPEYRHELAKTHHNLGNVLHELGRRSEASEELRRGLELNQKLAANFPTIPEYGQSLAANHHDLGVLLREMEKWKEAENEYRRALEIQTKLVRDFPAIVSHLQALTNSHNSLGILLKHAGKQSDAEVEYRRAMELSAKLAADFPTVPQYVLNLAASYGNYGNLVRDNNRPGDSLEWYGKAIATLQPVVQEKPGLITARRLLSYAHWGRAYALDMLSRHTDAAKDWWWAVELDDQKLSKIRLGQARSLARLGQPGQAVTMAEELARAEQSSSDTLHDCACVFALVFAATKDNATQQEQHAVRAVALLRQAHAAGYFKDAARVAVLKKDADLAALQTRDDWKELVAELEAKATPSKP